MPTATQIAAGREVRETLHAMERATRLHHRALKRLVRSFEDELPAEVYNELTDPPAGGGTPKDEDDD